MTHTRANAFPYVDADIFAVWVDYNKQNLATALTVEVDSSAGIHVEITLAQAVNGQTIYGQDFGIGTTSVPIPRQGNVTVGFDPNDGNAPFLTGVAGFTCWTR